VGYGDIFPTTRLGRVVAISASFSALIMMAICISIVQSKLAMSRADRKVVQKKVRRNMTHDMRLSAGKLILASLQVHRQRNKERDRPTQQVSAPPPSPPPPFFTSAHPWCVCACVRCTVQTALYRMLILSHALAHGHAHTHAHQEPIDLEHLRAEYPPPFAGQPDGGDEGPLGGASKDTEMVEAEGIAKTLQVSRTAFSLGPSSRFVRRLC
jgi:hypothetical protein